MHSAFGHHIALAIINYYLFFLFNFFVCLRKKLWHQINQILTYFFSRYFKTKKNLIVVVVIVCYRRSY